MGLWIMKSKGTHLAPDTSSWHLFFFSPQKVRAPPDIFVLQILLSAVRLYLTLCRKSHFPLFWRSASNESPFFFLAKPRWVKKDFSKLSHGEILHRSSHENDGKMKTNVKLSIKFNEWNVDDWIELFSPAPQCLEGVASQYPAFPAASLLPKHTFLTKSPRFAGKTRPNRSSCWKVRIGIATAGVFSHVQSMKNFHLRTSTL